MTRSKNTKSGVRAKAAAANPGLSFKTAMKKSFKPKVRKANPFEMRFVKEKHSVVNRKTKTDVGKPGISRAKAIQKRKDTLLQEYKRKDKTNIFVDKRIGEKDTELSAEDKMIARFAAERINQGKKQGSIFNLGEEETLTHFGKSLADIERYDDPRSDDEDEVSDPASKKLKASFVEEAHFGGFLTKADVDYASGKSNTRKDWIEQMIADSKKRKAEKSKDLEEAEEMTNDLDEKWKTLLPSSAISGKIYGGKKKVEDEDEKEQDDYNILMKELMFQSTKRAPAQERLKTDEEVVKEEKERLEKLEADRLKRMKGEDDDATSEGDDNEIEESAEDNEVQSDDDDDSEDDDDESLGLDEDDRYSDLESDEDEKTTSVSSTNKKDKKKVLSTEAIEAAQKAIPFTFAAPQSYEELINHFQDRSPKEKSIVIERIIKCNHPQFGENNKAHLEELFRFILQYIHECCEYNDEENIQPDIESAEALCPFLYDLAKFSPAPAAKSVLGVIQEKYEEYCKKQRSYPTLESLVFLKISLILFPASDYRHPVVTPSIQWMTHMLSTAKANTVSSFTSGLFISSMLIEAISLSKRFSPELINFLRGILNISTPEDKTVPPKVLLRKHVPPFKPVGKESTLFCDTFNSDKVQPKQLKLSDTVAGSCSKPITNAFSVTCLNVALKMLIELADIWKGLPSSKHIFADIKHEIIPKLPVDKLHSDIRSKIDTLSSKLESIMTDTEVTRKLSIAKQREKPITMLKLYEPELEDNFDPFQKKHYGSREKLEMDKLEHKVKREKKSAKKDLRKDTAFLAKQKAKEAREKDQERIRKTRNIMSGLGSQEGEYRKFLASKKKKKF